MTREESATNLIIELLKDSKETEDARDFTLYVQETLQKWLDEWKPSVHFSFLALGEKFVIPEGSEVDHPFEKTGRVFVKVSDNGVAYFNAAEIGSGDLFLFRSDSCVAPYKEK